MTAQFSETLLLDGKPTALCTEPLNSYFRLKGMESPFQSTCTALWRGYQGVWEIRNGRLYLLELEGVDASDKALKLDDIFPGYPERVFAHWYTGTLRLPRGKQLKYVHMGYASVHEEDLLIDVKRGLVVGRELRHNGTALDTSGSEGYSVAALTRLGNQGRGADAS